MKGDVIISGKIKFGMIRLGFPSVSLYPNNGFIWENKGGKCTFLGSCSIGNSSAVSIGKSGDIQFGNNFKSTAGLKLTSYYNIEFGNNVLIGWDNIFMDTDFHQLYDFKTKERKPAFGAIKIGNDNWFGAQVLTLKNTFTPEFFVVGSKSLISGDFSNNNNKCCIAAGNPARIIARNVYRDKNNDIINYCENV